VRKWSAWQATINQRAAACGKGAGYTFRRAKPSPYIYMIEGEGGRFGSTKRKHIIVHCGLHNVVQSGGQKENWPTLEHSPGEAACSNIERSIDSSAQGGDKACMGGGRVHHHIEGGEEKRDLFSRESTKHVTWNSGIIFVWFRKINWRELTCVPPISTICLGRR
jgi:hypothetical protein